MAESNFYVENPANKPMHYGNKPIVGVVSFPDLLPINRPYNYFVGEAIYKGLTQDVWEQQKKGNPNKVKKGVPKIIKYAFTTVLIIALALMGINRKKISLPK